MNILTIVLLASLFPTYVSSGPHVATKADLAYYNYYTRKVGIAKYYRPGLAEHVLKVRHMTRPLYVTGLASRPSCKTIGQVFYAKINGHPETLLQVDCAQYRDYQRQVNEGLVVEVDNATARRDGFIRDGRAPAIVWSR